MGMKAAAKFLGVNRTTMWRMVSDRPFVTNLMVRVLGDSSSATEKSPG